MYNYPLFAPKQTSARIDFLRQGARLVDEKGSHNVKISAEKFTMGGGLSRQLVNWLTCQLVNLSTCQLVNWSARQLVNSSVSQLVNSSTG